MEKIYPLKSTFSAELYPTLLYLQDNLVSDNYGTIDAYSLKHNICYTAIEMLALIHPVVKQKPIDRRLQDDGFKKEVLI